MGVLFQVWWCKRGSAGGNTREARRSLRADLEAISAILSRKFMSQLTQVQQVRANSCLVNVRVCVLWCKPVEATDDDLAFHIDEHYS